MSNDNYRLLTGKDFKKIAGITHYKSSYVRKLLKGHVDATDRNRIVLEEADKIQKEKIEELKGEKETNKG